MSRNTNEPTDLVLDV